VAMTTLDNMIKGGIHDHVGGGFHRYTVDPQWVVPHFEKMLYNQAGIGRALIQAHRMTGEARYARAARRLFDFVLRDMRAPSGGFYSAFDADSKDSAGTTGEGLFYVWTPDELKTVLGEKDATFAGALFDVTKNGNFDGRNVMHLVGELTEIAATRGFTVDELTARIDDISDRLRIWRGKHRQAPFRDEKILTAWNGAMIIALAEAGTALAESGYVDAAIRAGTFFWNDMGASGGKLMRLHFHGTTSLEATQQGYVFLALGYVALYDATGDTVWLDRAKKLAALMNARFFDKAANNYFMTVAGSGFYRPKTSTDGDLPSGNAAAVDLFARLAKRDLDPEYRASAESVLSAISGNAVDMPESNAYSLRAADQLLRGETGRKQYLSRGRVQATAISDADGKAVRVKIRIADGWHVNANKPLEDLFIPTVVEAVGKTGAPGLKVTYPEARKMNLGFHDKLLALYEGEIEIIVEATSSGHPHRKLALTVQTCNDKICLEPETVALPVVMN